MKYPPIWESASRPMFVKSVWLEAGHRHFILDYEPKQRTDSSASLRGKRDRIQTTVSCDFSELDNELLLVGSAKAACHQNLFQSKLNKPKTGNYRRYSSRRMFIDHFRRRYDLLRDETTSKRSSLYDINSVMTNASQSDEKLAERVLNWLDLAGKTPLLCPTLEPRKEVDRKKIKEKEHKQQESTCSKRAESVKHITIIFNKEGVPVRLNRPARNIDLCTVSSSAGAVRRLAGNLASARLYEDAVSGEMAGPSSGECKTSRPRTTETRKPTSFDSIPKKKVSVERESLALQETKKQLHIFMPSLPKKPLASEEAVCMELTNQCKI